MTVNQSADASPKSVAEDLMQYLRETKGVCAEGNVHGWRWIRFFDGEWQAVKYGGEHRLSEFVHGEIVDNDTVLNWLVSKPAQILPCSKAYRWRPAETTVWEDVDTQDVFKDISRCFYCGQSEQTVVGLCLYETTDQDECLLCNGCHELWADAGEIASGPLER
jgi:hypothetical protein